MHTVLYTNTYSHTRLRVHSLTDTCTLTYVHGHTHTQHSHMPIHRCVCKVTHTLTCVHTRSVTHDTHAHSHLCTHTHTHFHRVASPANSQGSQMTGDSHSSSSMFLTPPGKKEKGLLPAPHFPLYLPVFSVQNRSSNHQGVVLSREGNE